MKRKQYFLINLFIALALLLALVPGEMRSTAAQFQRASFVALPSTTAALSSFRPAAQDGGIWHTYTNCDEVNALTAEGNYVWAGTSGGVVRWNRNNGSYIKYTIDDGLVSSVVRAIAIDEQGRKWFGTEGGVNEFDGNTRRTYTIADGLAHNSVRSVAIDEMGHKWFGTWGGGVSEFDGSVWRTHIMTDGLANDYVMAIAVDEMGHKWFGTKDGVSEFDGVTWTTYTTADGLAHNYVMAIAVDEVGHKWFGTKGGVSEFDGVTWTTYTTASGLANDYVMAIAVDEVGHKWFGTRGGVSEFDGLTWTTGLVSTWVYAIAVDEADHKWFGKHCCGVSEFDGVVWYTHRITDDLAGNYVMAVAVDQVGHKWFGTMPGVSEFDGSAWRNHCLIYPGGRGYSSMAVDSAGHIWVGVADSYSWGGVREFDGHEWHAYSLPSWPVTDIAVDSEGRKWFATGGGVSVFDGSTWYNYSSDDGLAYNLVYAVAIDEAGHKWFGTNDGLSKFDGTTWATYTTADGLVSNSICSLAIDAAGHVWVGTHLDGVSEFDGAVWRTYTTDNGLADNRVRAIAVDERGHKWFGTCGDGWLGTDGGGVSEFDGVTWHTYTTADGLVDNCVLSIATDDAGHIWFGTSNGVSEFIPGGIQPNVELVGRVAGDIYAVAVQEDYAYVGERNRLVVLDISNPANPIRVGQTEAFPDVVEGILPTSVEDIFVCGPYAYVVTWSQGLWVIDVSNPTNPSAVGYCDTPGLGLNVFVSNSYAYVADGGYGPRVVDVSDPANLREVGYCMMEQDTDVFVLGSYAYVADSHSGLGVIDVSDPANPHVVGSHEMPGGYVGVFVAGSYAYVAATFYCDGVYDYGGLRVLDISNPANPQEVGSLYLGYRTGGNHPVAVSVSGTYVYLAGGYEGLRVVDVSTPTSPTGAGYYDTPGYASDVAVSGSYAYVADGDGGLLILQFTGGPGPFAGTISSIYPAAHSTVSTVMQGGTAYRHFRLTDSGGSPIPNATVVLSTGETAISDASGYFTVAIQADRLGGLGGHAVSVESVIYGGQTYFTQGEPSFEVEVIERRYAHSWECGAVRKASGGVSSGLVAYLSGEVNGGMALTLEENDPDATDDDQVTMAENYTGEAGAGFGADFSPSIEGGLVKVQGPGSHLVGELLLRTEAGVSSTFSDPYQKAAREAQGLMLLAGIADSITGFPGQPFLADILARANITLPYDEVTVGAGVHEQVDLGIDGLQLSFLIGKRDAELNAIDLNLLAATGDMTVMTGHRYYDTLVSEFCVLDLSWQASRLATEIGPIKNLIGNYVGEYVATVQEEVFYHQNTGQVNRIELSITGEGNDLTFTDIDQNRVTTRYIIPGDQIDQTVLNAAHNLRGLIRGVASSESADLEVGNDPIIAEINGLLGNVDFAEYEIIAEDGAQLNLVPEIGLEGTILKIDLGIGVELKQARQLVYQQGALLNGQLYPTASYQADGYVSRAGKNWLQLAANAVGGLWDLVKDAFNWVWRQVTSGMGWVIGTVSKTVDGVIQGGAQVIAPTGTQLYATVSGPRAATIRQANSITLTAVGWVPTSTGSTSRLGLSPAVTTASGEGFVVGGIYQFQPYTLAMSPAATLVITYTDEAAAGVDESRIGMFRWNLEGSNWQPMAAQIDLANNMFTASITQLGTFALGYDGTPPEVSILTPADGSVMANPLPLISALVVDTGVGINPATVQMRLDGQVVPAEYITGTGQLLYLPGTPLADGLHTVTVSAADVVGNPASVTTSFQVEIHRVYLPLVLRNF
ncbi:MAG: two-component regulator propeller domain-containing protein [Anaerolineae bacterium]